MKPYQNIYHRFIIYICLITIFVFAIWLPLVASNNIRFDSDLMIFHADEAIATFENSGRGGLVLFLKLMGLDTWNPLRSGLLFVIFFAASGFVFAFSLLHISNHENILSALIFYALYCSSPIWAFQGYFTLQIAGIGFGMFILSLSASSDALIISEDIPSLFLIIRLILSFIVLVYSLWIYQALAIYYVTITISLLYYSRLHGRTLILKRFFLWIIGIVVALVVYELLLKINNIHTTDYQESIICWGSIPFLSCFKNIIICFGQYLIPHHLEHISLFPLGALFLLFTIINTIRNKKYNCWLYFLSICLLALPLTMNIFVGNQTTPRMQFSLQVVSAFLVACLVESLKGKSQFIVKVICVITTILQCLIVIKLTYTDNIRSKQDYLLGNDIIYQLKNCDYAHKHIIFFGTVHMPNDCLATSQTDVFGMTFAEWSSISDDSDSSSTLGMIRLLEALDPHEFQPLTDRLLINDSYKESLITPQWPNEGYVTEYDQYILINLIH